MTPRLELGFQGRVIYKECGESGMNAWEIRGDCIKWISKVRMSLEGAYCSPRLVEIFDSLDFTAYLK